MCVHAVGKYEKAESINAHNNYKTMSEKRTGTSCVYTQWKSTKRCKALIHRMIIFVMIAMSKNLFCVLCKSV